MDITDSCMLYAKTLSTKGYAMIQVKINGVWKKRGLHRELYLAEVGNIPEGLVLDHLCRNRCCINVNHLEPVTNAVNIQRGHTRMKFATHCMRGHEFTPENTMIMRSRNRNCRTCRNNNQRAKRALAKLNKTIS